MHSIVMSFSVCLSVCLSTRICPEQHARSLLIFCACCLCLWLSPPPDKLMLGLINYQREGGDGSAQYRRSVIYNSPFFWHFWATVCKTVRPMLSVDSPVCLSILSVTLVYCGQTVGRIKMKLGMQVGLGPGHMVLGGDPAPLH